MPKVSDNPLEFIKQFFTVVSQKSSDGLTEVVCSHPNLPGIHFTFICKGNQTFTDSKHASRKILVPSQRNIYYNFYNQKKAAMILQQFAVWVVSKEVENVELLGEKSLEMFLYILTQNSTPSTTKYEMENEFKQ